MMNLLPVLNSYAVIRMDPVAMVADLQDPIALAEARKMAPKKYLVYLQAHIFRPPGAPQGPWHYFVVSPIATTMRCEDRAQGLTADMCIPIFPNMDHPSRAPLRSTRRPFPFPCCYHWSHAALKVRLRGPSAGEYDVRNACGLESSGHFVLQRTVSEDRIRRSAIREAAELSGAEASALNSCRNGRSGTPHAFEMSYSDASPRRVEGVPATPPQSGGGHSVHDDPSLSPISIEDVSETPEEPNELDIYPIVDIWYDLEAHMNPVEIPSPMELFEECRHIQQIIRAACKRIELFSAFANNRRSSRGANSGSRDMFDGAARGRSDRANPRRTVRNWLVNKVPS
ncbi:hypothetical protein C8Q80DRAFT_475935 [Daedaleopsis nitida]|nr:hypothetical protein C8Q80DRAFT_475935 [Daedaleopsis nitida]